MDEHAALIDLYASIRGSGGSAVLATVVRTSGSTYRRSGARMLVASDGRSAGLISGGCLESDLRERSADVLAEGKPLLVTYDATAPGDILWGLGLGCPGIAQVLLERVAGEFASPALEFLTRIRKSRKAGAIATVYASGSGGALGSLSFLEEGEEASSPADPLGGRLAEACTAALGEERSSHLQVPLPGGRAEAFIEYVPPQIALTVFGAGPDAAPLVHLAGEMGWHVTLVDPRTAYLRRELFPSADELVLEHPGERTLPPSDAFVVMTHNYENDVAAIRAIFRAGGNAYIGLLGPRTKAAMLMEKLALEGVVPAAGDTARLHAPVGLDIGAETPDEIALAIVAEIQAAIRDRPGTPLRARQGPIHR
ncbi:MAG TPA: XdhC family protein [Bacteroidota bacterium]|nr:XdhC family protein [Bacteroidota bacterium]